MLSLFKHTNQFTQQVKPLTFSLTQTQDYEFSGLKQLKGRMKSVNSIKKITKAMKMVAASKMRHDVKRLVDGRDFAVSAVQNVLNNESYLQKKGFQPVIKKTLIVPFSSDKGMCGGINSSTVRFTKQKISEMDRASLDILVIGDKGTAGLKRACPDLLRQSINEIQTPVAFPVAASVAHQIELATQEYESDQIIFIFNVFKSAISTILTENVVLSKKHFMQQFKYLTKHSIEEPEKEYQRHYLYELYVAGQVFNMLLNNIASETSARMNAMENASKNAGEMLEKLTLKYNRLRQAKVTTELCEIISGASAL